MIVLVTYTCRPGKAAEFVNAIRAEGLQEVIRQEAGCLQYDYHQSLENPDVVLLLERWDSSRAQERHMTQPHMSRISALNAEYVELSKVEKYQ